MRIVYPLLWSTLGRQACCEQSVKTAAALARRGHDVTLLMPKRRDDPVLTASDLREWFAVEGDFRLMQRASRRVGERLVSSLLWLRQAFRDPLLASADLVYSRIPAMLGAGHLCPLPFATDHYRPWPDELPLLRPLFRYTARHRNCLGLVLHSDYAANAYRRAGLPPDRLLVAHNGADPAAAIGKNPARAQLDLPVARPIAAYAGRISTEKGLEQVLAAAALRPDILFLLVGSEGDGPIERAAAERENVRVIPWAEPATLPAWLAAADVLLVPASRAPLERFRQCVLPMKLFAYLAAHRPILAPLSPDTAELLRHGENAWLIEPDRPEIAAAALDRLLGDAALASRLARNASDLAGSLSWDARAERIGAFLQARLARRLEYRSASMPAAARVTAAGK